MRTVKLTKAELATLDAMIETLKEQGTPRDARVPLRRLAPAMQMTVMIDAYKVATMGPRILAEDTKILAQVGKLIAKLQSKTSLTGLLELRKSALGKKDSPA